MKLTSVLLCGWIALAAVPLPALQVHGPSRQEENIPEGPKIRILLEKDASSAFLEAKGPYKVVRKDSGTVLSTGSVGKRFVIHALQDGIRWGEEYPDVYQIAIVPLKPETFIYVNGIQYKGNVSIYHVKNNRITIVNEVSIEEYLKSTLALQDENLSKEALAALAIAARTDAYNRVLQGQSINRPWDVVAQDVNYFGYGITQQKNGRDESIDWTRYMVLESVKENKPAQNVKIKGDKADELAQKGYDAQKILRTLCPQTKIGATISPDEVAIR